jgi:protein-disulfide isomerase
MSSETCPTCGDQFDSAGAVRDHAWDEHRACHYCGQQIDGDDKTVLYKHWLMTHPDDLRNVDEKQANSAVDSITFSDRLESEGVGGAVAGLPRRYFLLAGGLTGAAAIAGGGAVLASRSGGLLGRSANPVDDYEYGRIGADDATATITYFGSYKCPHCARFNSGMFEELLTEYVEPGDLAIVYRNLSYFNGRTFLGSDAPNPGHAGLAVYNNDPDVYLDYHDRIFEMQSSVSRWTADRLANLAEEVGMSDPGVIRTAVQERQYINALEATDQAAQDAGVEGTPGLLIDGSVVTPAPGNVRPLIDDLIASQ